LDIEAQPSAARDEPRPAREGQDLSAIARMLGTRRLFFEHQLRISNKGGRLIPFAMNRCQQHVDRLIDEQRSKGGRVRAIILKGRQLGCSTYVAGRYYHRTAVAGSVNVFILAHDIPTTNKLFNIAKRFFDKAGDPRLNPIKGKSNRKELLFPHLDAGYEVGTAGSANVGRGGTVQLFHGSEVAFWPNAEDIAAGAMESISDEERGTEIVLESTANGIGGFFYQTWVDAEAGRNEYVPIFLPWYWHHEYEETPDDDFVLEPEEMELQETYRLTDAQINWRRKKIAKPGWSEPRFQQEYPMNAQEAFQMAAGVTLIQPKDVVRARKNDLPDDKDAPLVMGVDCAWSKDGDRTKMLSRQGRRLGTTVNHAMQTDDTMEIVGVIADFIRAHNIAMTFIDLGGAGKGVYDRLRELGYSDRVQGINFGDKAQDPVSYYNKRSEMYGLLDEWLRDPGGADIPDDDLLHRHLCSSLMKQDSKSRTRVEAKAVIRKEFGFSPDEADAAALTFARPVVKPETTIVIQHRREQRRRRSWMAS